VTTDDEAAYGAAQPIIAAGKRRFADHAAACDRVRPGVGRVVGATGVADADPEIIGAAYAIAAGPILAVLSIAICRARSRPSAASWPRRHRGRVIADSCSPESTAPAPP